MKAARFITHPDYITTDTGNPWSHSYFNSYDRELEPGKGILCVSRDFGCDAGRGVKSVTLRATALGIFDLFVNGKRVGGDCADEYKPGWTDYTSRVFEYEYNITDMCGETNRITAEVSPGWWSGRISFGYYGFRPCSFAGEIEIVYSDGSSTLISSGTDWQAYICGPVLRADIWDGEYYDATLPHPALYPEAHPHCDAVIVDDIGCAVVPKIGPPIRVRRDLTRRPTSAVIHKGSVEIADGLREIITLSRKVGGGCERGTLHAGEALLTDMGQNMVGRPAFRVKAPRGTVIKAYVAEMLNDTGDEARGNDGPRGSMYIKNYRSALARTVYVASGEGEEYFYPTHSFYGFRYLELRADRDIEVLSLEGQVICSEFDEVGEFFCDNPEVNRLWSNILWGMRGNYLSVPTDCPQRDERLGWTGDTQVFCGAASYIADIRSFMEKWLGDLRDSQADGDGGYCDVAPRVFHASHSGNAAWADAGLIVPHRLWLMYGDTSVLADNIDSMEAYMKYLSQYGLDGPNTAYGDWLNYHVTDKRYIAVCCYAYDAALMEKFHTVLGNTDRAAYYRGLREQIVAHWRERYVDGDSLKEGTQTAYLLAFAYGLVTDDLREAFLAHLKESIIKNNYTLSTGFIGTGILNRTLAQVGFDGLAYSLLLQTDDPSWLYSVRQGATTVWERWNSYTLARGFGDVGMNSFNHYAYGAVAEWMFSGMCGIAPDPDAPGFRHFILRPTPDMRSDDEMPVGQSRIGMAKASYRSVCGMINCGWNRDDIGFNYDFSIPEGTSARVELVCPDGQLRLNGLDCTVAELNGRIISCRAVFELASGKYTVTVTHSR